MLRANVAKGLAEFRAHAREAVLDKDLFQLLLARLIRQTPSAPDEHDERLALAGLAKRSRQRVLQDSTQRLGRVELFELDTGEVDFRKRLGRRD